MTSRTLKLTAFATTALVSALMAVGCSSTKYDPYDVSFDNIRKDLSPELRTTTERDVDVQVAIALMKDQNWRMFYGDFGRAFHTDHPSRLTPFPVPYRTGRPR
ncbi:MAG: hypothetical protein KC983_02420 [Phycisphaerales bacterium]|nr:hypothetical protein [Phycisphaerales bacterium]